MESLLHYTRENILCTGILRGIWRTFCPPNVHWNTIISPRRLFYLENQFVCTSKHGHLNYSEDFWSQASMTWCLEPNGLQVLNRILDLITVGIACCIKLLADPPPHPSSLLSFLSCFHLCVGYLNKFIKGMHVSKNDVFNFCLTCLKRNCCPPL